MNEQQFLESLFEVSELFRLAQGEIQAEWAPEKVPGITRFEALGTCAADNFHLMNERVRESLFDLIELGIVDGDEPLRTAICTGLIEALAVLSANDATRWVDVRRLMRERSGAHADAWLSL